jgi:IS5 family transposase
MFTGKILLISEVPAPSGQFVLHAMPCRATLTTVARCETSSRTVQKLAGCEIERAYVDKGYRSHDARNPRRVFTSGQKRGVFSAIKRELRRHLGRCYFKGRTADAANTILTAVGYKRNPHNGHLFVIRG